VLKFHSAGESHGPRLVVLVENMPAGVPVDAEAINKDLARRQQGYGRGGRMAIEADKVEFVAGVRWGKTTGAPVAMTIENRDWKNWREKMSADLSCAGSAKPLTEVRPGHADFPGALKYDHFDARNILERSSARETASRVAAGALAKALLSFFEIKIGSFVTSVGGIAYEWSEEDLAGLAAVAEVSPLRMADKAAETKAMVLVDEAKAKGDTLGGAFICFALGLPVGLGSHVSWERRLDGKLGQSLLSIPARKGVEFGIGFQCAERPGSMVHDEIVPGGPADARRGGVRRLSNRAGGLEGGMTNGEALWARCAMKPIPTLMSPLKTVDMISGEEVLASKERSDVLAVPAAAVVGEAMMALTLAEVFCDKFGGDSLTELERNLDGYLAGLERRWKS